MYCLLYSSYHTILPGEKGKITYNMALGPIRKTLTVESNAVNYEGGRVALKIKGEVISINSN
jgi:hypothetical protein